MVGLCVFVKNRKLEATGFQFHVIDNQSSVFEMKNFHPGAETIDKNKYIARFYILTHLVIDDAT